MHHPIHNPRPQYAIHPASPRAMDHISKRQPRERPGSAYPFALMSVGECFTIPMADAKHKTLETLCSLLAPHLNMRFKIFKHPEHGLIEVARVE